MKGRWATGIRISAVAVALACSGAGDRGAAGDVPAPRGGSATDEGSAARTAKPAVQVPPGGDAALASFDDHFGIYLNGAKVGWMRTTLSAGEEAVLTTELHAKVGGMGQVSEVTLRERRTYARGGELGAISFSQTAATGAVEVVGKRDGDRFVVETKAGGASSQQVVDVQESLADAIAAQRLAQRGKVGERLTSRRFDPSVLKVLEATHVIAAAEKRVLAGVETDVLKIETRYPELGIDEAAWVDRAGSLLESRIGGFFVARLEPPEVAKRLDYSQDLLVSAVVPVPTPLVGADHIEAMTVRFSGFGEHLPPGSQRQVVTRKGRDVELSLSRERPRPAPWRPGTTPSDPALRELVAATPFIQSDDPRLREQARAVVGDAADLPIATERLARFVYEHVRDEYVPAYSNALEAWQSRRGDCTEHSVLFVALARALGIPARVAVGIAYWPPARGFGWHAWAEVHDGNGWYTVDPTWNQPIADATHIKLAEGGPAEQARIVMLLGALKVVELKVGDRG